MPDTKVKKKPIHDTCCAHKTVATITASAGDPARVEEFELALSRRKQLMASLRELESRTPEQERALEALKTVTFKRRYVPPAGLSEGLQALGAAKASGDQEAVAKIAADLRAAGFEV